jgi:hypothetical protein
MANNSISKYDQGFAYGGATDPALPPDFPVIDWSPCLYPRVHRSSTFFSDSLAREGNSALPPQTCLTAQWLSRFWILVLRYLDVGELCTPSPALAQLSEVAV